jgi:hypothetical protein
MFIPNVVPCRTSMASLILFCWAICPRCAEALASIKEKAFEPYAYKRLTGKKAQRLKIPAIIRS